MTPVGRIAAIAILGMSGSAWGATSIYTTSGSTDLMLREISLSGTVLHSWSVPYPGGTRPLGDDAVRSVTIGANGRVYVFNGTWEPYISSLNPSTGQWTHMTIAGLSIPNSVYRSSIAAYGNYLFAADWSTGSGADLDAGIVRFDLTSGASERFYGTGASRLNITSLTMGNDGKLYAHADYESNIRVYNPQTMQLDHTVTLANTPSFNDLDVDAAGNIYIVTSGKIAKFSTAGALLNSTNTSYGNLYTIDVANDGKVAIGHWGANDFFTLNNDLSGMQRVGVSDYPTTHLTFAEAVPEPSSLVVLAGCAVFLLGCQRRQRKP